MKFSCRCGDMRSDVPGFVVDFSRKPSHSLPATPLALRQRAIDAIFTVSERARDMIVYTALETAFCRSEREAGFRITYTGTADRFIPLDIRTTRSPRDDIREAFVVLRGGIVHEIPCLGRGNRPVSTLEPGDAATGAAPGAILGGSTITIGMGDLVVTGGSVGDTIFAGSADSSTITIGMGDLVVTGGSDGDTIAGGTDSGPIVMGAGGAMIFVESADNHLLCGGVPGRVLIDANAGGVVIGGNAGSNAIMGGAGNTIFAGSADSDTLFGGCGNVMLAGAGVDLVVQRPRHRHNAAAPRAAAASWWSGNAAAAGTSAMTAPMGGETEILTVSTVTVTTASVSGWLSARTSDAATAW